LRNKALKGDKDSAYTLYEISQRPAPSYTAPVKASTTIGSGDNGTVTVTADIAWEAGNDYTIEVVVDAGANAGMTAELTGNDILITLGTGASAGVVDNAKNTATLIETAINAIVGKGFTADASGTGASSITGAVTKKNFTGGVNEVMTTERKVWNLAVGAVSQLFA